MPFLLRCECGKKLLVEDELAGRRIRCPACKNVLRAPTEPPPAPRPERAAEGEAPTPPKVSAAPLEEEKVQAGPPAKAPPEREVEEDEGLPPRRIRPSRTDDEEEETPLAETERRKQATPWPRDDEADSEDSAEEPPRRHPEGKVAQRSRKGLWIGLGAGAVAVAAGIVLFVILTNTGPGKGPDKGPSKEKAPGPDATGVAGEPVDAAERERRLQAAQANEKEIVKTLSAKAKDFGVKSTLLRTIKVDHEGAFAFSPDGKHLAIGRRDGKIEIRGLLKGDVVQTLPGHERKGGFAVRALAYAPAGDALVSSGVDEMVRIWDLASGKPKHELSAKTFVMAVSPDGTRLLTDLLLRNLDSGEEVKKIDQRVLRGVFSPGGTRFALSGFNEVFLYDAANAELIKTIPLGKGRSAESLSFSPDDKTLAIFVGDITVAGDIVLVDLETGAERKIPQDKSAIPQGGFSPDGRFLAATNINGSSRIRFWDAATLNEQTFPHWSGAGKLVFSPGGMLLATTLNPFGSLEIHVFALPHGVEPKAGPP